MNVGADSTGILAKHCTIEEQLMIVSEKIESGVGASRLVEWSSGRVDADSAVPPTDHHREFTTRLVHGLDVARARPCVDETSDGRDDFE